MLACILAAVFLVGRYGKEQQWFAGAEDRFPISHFIKFNTERQMCLTDRFNGSPMSEMKGFRMFFDKAGETTPIVFSNLATKLTSMQSSSSFTYVHWSRCQSISKTATLFQDLLSRIATVLWSDTATTTRLLPPISRQSFMSSSKIYLTNERLKRVRLSTWARVHEDHADGSTMCDEKKTVMQDEADWNELAPLDRAFNQKVLYVIGKEQMKIRQGTNLVRRLLLLTFL